MLGRMWKQGKPYVFLVGIQRIARVEKLGGFSKKSRWQFNNATPKNIPTGMKIRDLSTITIALFVILTGEDNQVSIHRWMDKESVVYPCNATTFYHKKQCQHVCTVQGRVTLKHYAK